MSINNNETLPFAAEALNGTSPEPTRTRSSSLSQALRSFDKGVVGSFAQGEAGVPPTQSQTYGEDKRTFEDAVCKEPIYENIVYWYPMPVTIPKATKLIFDDPEIYNIICDFCRSATNFVVETDGRITQALCEHCRVIIGRHESNRCTGGTNDCIIYRYVDAVGAIAHLCRGCHRHGEAQRRDRRERDRRPGHTSHRQTSLAVK